MHSISQAKPLEMALGSLLIQKQYGFSDEELAEQLRENPYYQYFIGMSGYEEKYPFVPSLLVEFRKRLFEEILNEVNEIIGNVCAPDLDFDVLCSGLGIVGLLRRDYIRAEKIIFATGS